MTSIKACKWLLIQGCAFRGHDESPDSLNRENFIELIKSWGDCNEEMKKVVLENAPGNAKYTSPKVQKEILNIYINKVRNMIQEEIRNANYCILVDEALDEGNKEQMAIVLRFVDGEGFVRERFFDIVEVVDTKTLTLQSELCTILARHDLQVQGMRGQGYDGASNMHGARNGLQALFLKDCPYAYYVHCFAHQLQLALVAVSKYVRKIWQLYSNLSVIINFLSASPKRHAELKSAWEIEICTLSGYWRT